MVKDLPSESGAYAAGDQAMARAVLAGYEAFGK